MLRIGSDGKATWGEYFRPVLAALGDENCQVKIVDVAGTRFGDEGMTALANALRTNGSLRQVTLGNNAVTFEGFSYFVNAMKDNQTLVDVQLAPADLAKIAASINKQPKTIRPELLEKFEHELIALQRQLQASAELFSEAAGQVRKTGLDARKKED